MLLTVRMWLGCVDVSTCVCVSVVYISGSGTLIQSSQSENVITELGCRSVCVCLCVCVCVCLCCIYRALEHTYTEFRERMCVLRCAVLECLCVCVCVCVFVA